MGFFSTGELKKKTAIEVDIDQLEPKCIECGLYRQCNSPKMKYTGEGRKKILIIAEAPGKTEDEYGVQLVGEAGKYLKEELSNLKISINKDCWKINAVNCRPTDNRTPTKKEIKFCYPLVEKTIKELKPKLIILCGSIAVESLFGEDYSDRSINRWRAYRIPDEKFKCYIVPIFHPSYILRNENDKNLKKTFQRDLKRAISTLKLTYIEQKNHEEYISILRDFNAVKTVLERIIRKKPTIAFDYETTGLKPYRDGMKVVSIGVAVSPTKAFAFPFDYKSYWTNNELKQIRRLWSIILEDKNIKKVAHNLPFEDTWSTIFIKSKPKGWFWDTMLCEHIIDNRSKSNKLKFQTFVRYGIRPYDKHIKPFLEAKKGHFNTVEKAPFKDLLIYNGLDCIYTYMLMNDQASYMSKMKELLNAYRLFFKSTNTLSSIHMNGICMNMNHYKSMQKQLTDKITKSNEYLESGREAKKFRKKYGRNIKITSNQDLGKLFYEVLGKNPIYTEKGAYKTDKKTLESLNLPFVDTLAAMKRYEKARNTYLAQFAREVYKGKMHPFFGLIVPRSYRSSSSKPNFQNLPKRDEEIKRMIRKGITPSPECVICESDFSGAEVITSASYHRDSTFVHDITIGDMHRDLATEIFMLPENLLAEAKIRGGEEWARGKKIRFHVKNDFTFAEFYGDWFGSCGPMMWEDVVVNDKPLPDGTPMRDWLEHKGIYELGEIIDGRPTPGSFLEHVKDVEERMWNERFPLYTQWKKDIVDFYYNYGYIETYFGFRFTGYMDRKQCTNYPIQGTSFHLLLVTLNDLNVFIRKNKMRTKLIGQIHDSILADVPKDEISFYLKGVNKIVSGLKDRFNWLIVPMEIEAEISRLHEDGGNFAEMKEVDPLNVKLW